MEPVAQLADFFEAIAGDTRIGPVHIALYTALLHDLVLMPAQVHCTIDRDSLMSKARVSRKTYHKTMRELCGYGYIRYEPSSHPDKRSRVHFNKL